MNFRRLSRPEVAINLTPLIDVVFLLLIFFMVSTSFSEMTQLVVDLPEAEGIAAIPGSPARQQAFNDLVMDADRVVRRDLMHVGEQEEAVRSLPLRLLETARQTPHLDHQLEQLNPQLWLEEQSGGYRNLDAAGFQTMLPVYPPGRYPTVDLEQVLSGTLPERLIRDRIVLIGHVAPSLRDLFEIPHSRFKTSAQFFEVPGVELHAQRLEALQSLLEKEAPPIRAAQGWQRDGLLLAMVRRARETR